MHAQKSAVTIEYRDCINRKFIVQLKQQTSIRLRSRVAIERKPVHPQHKEKVQSCVLNK